MIVKIKIAPTSTSEFETLVVELTEIKKLPDTSIRDMRMLILLPRFIRYYMDKMNDLTDKDKLHTELVEAIISTDESLKDFTSAQLTDHFKCLASTNSTKKCIDL